MAVGVRRAHRGKRGSVGCGTASGLKDGGPGSGELERLAQAALPDVAMVEATDFGNRDDPAEFRRLDWSSVGRILGEGKVRARPVIVREIAGQGAAQVAFAEDEDMIQTLLPDRADQPLCEGILPWAVGRGQDFSDAHALHAVVEGIAIDLVAIAEEVGRCGVVREGLHDLLGRPLRGRVLGHVEVDDASAMVGEHNKDEEHPQARRGHREEIDRDQVSDVVGEEGAPGLSSLGLRPAKAHENRAGLN